MCHIERLSPVDFFNAVLIEACVRSSFPIVCACLIDAWLICFSSISIISARISQRNCDPLSDSPNVGQCACLVMTSTIHRPIKFAIAFSVE